MIHSDQNHQNQIPHENNKLGTWASDEVQGLETLTKVV